MDNDTMMRRAPSIFAEQASGKTSKDYRFLPTIRVIDALRDAGYSVTHASQSRSLTEDGRQFAKHMVRLRHRDNQNPANVGDEIPELVLVNSHNRLSSYNLMAGIFRLVCSNGLVVASSTVDSLRVTHTGSKDLLQEVIDVSARIADEAPKAMAQINRWKAIELDPEERRVFAEASLEIMPTTMDVMPEELLRVRRAGDSGPDLWRTMNVVQENMLRGGIVGRGPSNRLARTREIKNITANVSVNRALWTLAEEMAKLKA